MQLSYKARYYNGRSSTPFVADVSFGESAILIGYTDHNGEYIRTEWDKTLVKESDFSSAIVTLRYGEEFPYQQLEVTDRGFVEEYRMHFRVGLVKRWLHLRTGSMLLFIIGGFIVSIVLAYLFVLPFIADRIARTFPREYEISLGERLYAAVLQNQKIDTAKTETINRFFKGLHVDTEYPVKITVVKDNTVNAFALPGGGIVVYDAMLDKLDRPEELAALLSHEYSHVELKHATRNVFRSLAGYLFISVLFSDVSGIAAVVVQNADNLRNLKYSRDLEHEADENGLQIMKQNKLDPEGMARLFETLKKEEHAEISEYLSTHPELDSRIGFVRTFKAEHPYQARQDDKLNTLFHELKGDSTVSW